MHEGNESCMFCDELNEGPLNSLLLFLYGKVEIITAVNLFTYSAICCTYVSIQEDSVGVFVCMNTSYLNAAGD